MGTDDNFANPPSNYSLHIRDDQFVISFIRVPAKNAKPLLCGGVRG